jgi:membrane protein required for beta-lactamase induction
MKLLALIFGFGLEHFATQLLHLRELRWFDAYFDIGLQRGKHLNTALIYVVLVVLLALPMLPVLAIHLSMGEADIRWDIAYILFALLVVFICLGPRDLGNEVDEYCAALDAGDQERARAVSFELAESRRRGVNEVEIIEDAIFVQAPNRIFGVVFWFIVLGPVGAWLFRVSDLLRRRTAFEAARDEAIGERMLPPVERVHALLLWLPVRLAALGYALSGSFDDALNYWRSQAAVPGEALHRRNDLLAAGVGRAAMTGFLEQPANSSLAARNAMRLVTRTLFIWMIVIALMTIFGWAV